ncbi:Hsp70 family protein [Nocardia sp. NBC_01499]|uniref:Hsp70 family protein n=1 Tax=Nocardia sp. NBC_01499 TaxID=2903597 RepID=UPI00386666D8
MTRQISLLDHWPGQPFKYPKTPSCLLLNTKNKVVAWGAEAKNLARTRQTNRRMANYKLKKGSKISLHRRHTGSQPGGVLAINDQERSRERLAAMMLKQIYDTAVSEVSLSGYGPDDIRWSISVPATWEDSSKQATRRAAVAAGYPDERLTLIYEPEAAAYYVRVSGIKPVGIDGAPLPDMNDPGARFVVVDCGGGTVDITTYQVEDDGGLGEIGKPTGGLLGSLILNKAFQQRILTSRLGGKVEYKRLSAVMPSIIGDLIDAFEQAKYHVSAQTPASIDIPIPVELHRNLTDETIAGLRTVQDGVDTRIVVNPDEVRSLFEEVIAPITEMIDVQLDELQRQTTPRAGGELIILVGGFARSSYLKQRLNTHFRGRASILIPPHPEAAVLIGGAHYSYDPQTRRRRSKYTYGIAMAKPFESGDPENAAAITWEGDKVCTERFGIFVRAGDSVAVGQEVTEEDLEPIGEKTRKVSVRLFRTRDRDPRYVTDTGCEEIGSMSLNLRDVMHLEVPKRGFDVSISFGETELSATATQKANGVRKQMQVDFHDR